MFQSKASKDHIFNRKSRLPFPPGTSFKKWLPWMLSTLLKWCHLQQGSRRKTAAWMLFSDACDQIQSGALRQLSVSLDQVKKTLGSVLHHSNQSQFCPSLQSARNHLRETTLKWSESCEMPSLYLIQLIELCPTVGAFCGAGILGRTRKSSSNTEVYLWGPQSN